VTQDITSHEITVDGYGCECRRKP